MAKPRTTVDDLRGATRLAVEATRGITELVEAMHRTILGGPEVLGRPLEGPARMALGPIYGGIRAVTKLVGDGIDGALAQLAPLLSPSAPAEQFGAARAVLCGVLGDYLCATGNPLAITMALRHAGTPLVLEREAVTAGLGQPSGKIVVLVHGSCVDDLRWHRDGHDHGAALAETLGCTSIYLHYNSGLHISSNGHGFALLLEQLTAAWPVPIDSIVVVGHSMGGLVARSACEVGETEGHTWRRHLTKLVCLGSPHHGAPLERGGNWIDFALGISRYSAPLARLGKIRSAGVTDLRFGIVRAADWADRDRFERGADPRTPLPLPAGVACYAVAGTLTKQLSARLQGDGLVPVDSALGRGASPALDLGFPEDRRWIAVGTSHIDLLSSADVYAKLLSWVGEDETVASA